MPGSSASEIEKLQQAIAALEAQRLILGEAVVNTALAPLREKLAALEPAQSEQQRKQATLLFADVKGFTAMSEQLDAEDLTELMNALWERLDAAITAHGGRIDKHIGDSVMALWGAGQAGEDDPENAIRAALAMQAELAGFRADRKVSLGMRIGINSGPVLVGAVGSTHEFTAMGDTVNTASRLEGAAPVDGVLIGHDTYRLVRGIFDLQALEPVTVKGKTGPLQVYRVLGAKPRAFRLGTRGVAGVETRLVGREGELARLQDGLQSVLEEGALQMVTVLGEAGVGKSRLLYEFENWIDLLPEQVLYFKGRAYPQEQSQPYALLRDLFAYRFQIGEDEPLSAVWAKLEAGFEAALGPDEKRQMKAHFTGQLLGYDFSQSPHLAGALNDARQIHDRALMYLIDYFRALSAGNPVALFLEDLHWADDASLDALDQLGHALQASRVCVVGLARPELLERRPQWGLGQLYQTRLELAPLTRHASRQLLAEILRKAGGAPPELSELVVQAAEGNPFYIEELVKMLMEQGVILAGDDRWEIQAGRLAEVHVPPTLTGVLQARLDRLTPEERATLQQASVVGRVFWEKLVATLGAAPDVAQELRRLQGRELVFQRERSEFQGTREYIFKHALLRDVAYESVLKRVRRRYHELVAHWLIEQGGERLGEYLGLIGEHLERAGLAAAAADYLRRAGVRAAAAYANQDAIAYFTHALALLARDDRQGRWELLLQREAVYHLIGNRDSQLADLQVLQALLNGEQDLEKQAETALRWAEYAWGINDYAEQARHAQRAIAAAQALQDRERQAAGQRLWASALINQNEDLAAFEHYSEALRLARACGRGDLEAMCLRPLSNLACAQGDFARQREYMEQSLAISRRIGNRKLESEALFGMGMMAMSQGEFDRARQYNDQAIALCRETGDRPMEAYALSNQGEAYTDHWDYSVALGYLEQAYSIIREISDQDGLSNCLLNFGATAACLGQYSLACGHLEQALLFCRETNSKFRNFILSFLARILAEQGNAALAASWLAQVHVVGPSSISPLDYENYTLTSQGCGLVDLGRFYEAQPILLRAVELQQGWNRGEKAEVLAALARACLALGDQAGALAQVEAILAYLGRGGQLYGAFRPVQVYLTGYQVLATHNDPRAEQALQAGYDLLHEIAARIPEAAERRSFLENVPCHREITTEWRKRCG